MSKLGTENITQKWIHADQILDSLKLDEVFKYESEDGRQFNFKLYYEEVKSLRVEDIMKKVLRKYMKIANEMIFWVVLIRKFIEYFIGFNIDRNQF